jgi:CRP-like cAMP-binding protein
MELFHEFLLETLEIPYEDLHVHTEMITVKAIAKNEFVLMPGQISKYTFFTEKGLLRMYSLAENGKEHIVQFAPEKWLIFDRKSMYKEVPTKFFIQATEDSEIVFLQKGVTEEIIASYPQSAVKFTLMLNSMIARLQNRVGMLIGASAEERYLEFLETYPGFINRVPLYMIASYLGITPESLSRVRSGLS